MGAARRADRILRARPLMVALVLVLAWVGLGVRLFQVQVVRAAELSEASLSERLTRRDLAPDRGTIFDRDGGTLAVSILGKTVAANPQAIVDVDITANLLSAALDLDLDQLRERLSSDASFVFVKRQLEPSEVEAVIEMGLPGIFTLDEPKRVYPAESLAAHVVGFVDIDSNGLVQFWGYAKPDHGGILVPGQVGCDVTQLPVEQVGPCGAGMGTSIF